MIVILFLKHAYYILGQPASFISAVPLFIHLDEAVRLNQYFSLHPSIHG